MKSNRILVVDDDSDQLSMLSLILETENYEVYQASNGRSGLELLQSQSIDLVVTDIAMPEMDGLEFATRLRKLSGHERTPVVLVTAGRESMEFSSHSFRADGFCLKQHMSKHLLPSLRSLLATHVTSNCA